MLYTKTLSRMLDDAFSFPLLNMDTYCAYDEVKHDKSGTKITIIVPGFSKEDLQLSISNNHLTLSSKLEDKKISRNWKLSDSADAKNVKAECKNGILTIDIPLKTKSDKSSIINID